MRQIALATGLALALAAMFALSPAKAEFNGALQDGQGHCKQFNSYNPNRMFYYWGPCPSHEAGRGRPTRIIKVTNGGVGSGIGRGGVHHHHKA